jgi:hypothetical protein
MSSPNIVLFKILPVVTAFGEIVVAKEPAVLVTSPVNAGTLAVLRIPVTLVPERSTAFAVITYPAIVR